MRLRRVELTGGGRSVAVWDEPRERWLPLVPALKRASEAAAATDAAAPEAPPIPLGETEFAALGAVAEDLVAFLAGGEQARAQARALADRVAVADLSSTFALEPALLPFAPRSLRGFATSQRHWEQSARGLVRRYLPRALPAVTAFERLTGRTFPPLRPGRLFFEQPSFYFGNHLTCYPDGATLPWPAFCRDLDFELELGAVLAHPLRDAASEAEAEAAIGGFVVLDDLSARDVQWREHRDGLLGPLGKTKTFATALGAEVVTADELLPRLRALTGTVHVNGELWSRTSTAEQLHSFGAMVAHASAGEQLFAGELLSAGTLPGGCGLELNRWLSPGDALELEIEGVGRLRNAIGARGDSGPPPPGE